MEEQFHLPPALVDWSDGQCWKQEMVGQEPQSLFCFYIEAGNASQRVRACCGGSERGEDDGVIGSQAYSGRAMPIRTWAKSA